MKVAFSWLEELVDLKVPIKEVIRLLPLRTVGIKEETAEYFELDMKGYNRADLLSLRGVAYEIAAITDSKVNFSEPEKNEYIWVGQNLPKAELVGTIGSKALVYCIAKIENLNIEPSPQEWISKFHSSGLRSVDNITDITNLVMLEYGQPLHAFDALKSKGIHVEECPFDDWKFTTLDNKERILKKGDILIRNRTEIIGLGGIMGGKNSEVTKKTTSVHLEAAVFDPKQIRQTATRLGLQSEASKRFYHGLTTKRQLQALDAAIKMYQELGGKLTAISLIDQRELPNYPLKNRSTEQMKKTILIEKPTPIIKLTQEKVSSLIGIDIPPKEIESSLNKLGFKLASHIRSGNVNWDVTVPYWRLDIEIEEDLIEEVARMYGYEKILPKGLSGKLPEKIDQSFYGMIYKLKTALVDFGLTEVQTYSFYSTKVISSFQFPVSSLIKLLNPMSAETEYMRNMLWPNLLEVTAKNIRQGYRDIAIFEIGKAYWPQGKEPKEGYRLSIALMNGTDNPTAELSVILNAVKDLSIYLSPTSVEDSSLIAQNDNFFHPTRYAALEKDGQEIGWIAEIHPRIVNKFGIEQRVAVLEIEIDSSLVAQNDRL